MPLQAVRDVRQFYNRKRWRTLRGAKTRSHCLDLNGMQPDRVKLVNSIQPK